MITTLLLASTLLMAGQSSDPVVQPFVTPLTVKSADRLALTPKIDGVLAPEEWDPLATQDGVDSYFQWAPRCVYVAAVLPIGKDLVVSLDLKGDGWLVGNDNLEIRVSWNGTTATTKMRVLDATRTNGPQWTEAGTWESCFKVAATAGTATWTAELEVCDPGLGILPKSPDRKMGIRVDALASAQTDLAPYLPRITMPVNLVLDRAVNLMTGFSWKPEFRGRNIVPGDHLKLRFVLRGTDALGMKRIEMRTEGLAEANTTLKAQPFPSYDRKGRAFVDYDTNIGKDADSGYRIVRATIQNAQGEPTILQSSYEIAQLVKFDLMLPSKIVTQAKQQTYKISVYIRSNVLGRLDGTFVAVPPKGWSIDRGSDKSFIIYASRGSVRKVFDLTVPPDVKGSFPVKFVADFGRGKIVEEIAYIEVK